MMIKKVIYLWIVMSAHVGLTAQMYSDYYGAGHTIGIKSTSSSDASGQDVGNHSLSGSAFIPDQAGAARFFSQATLGWNQEDIDHLSQIGVKAWLDEQIALPHSSYLSHFFDIYDEAIADITAVHGTDFNKNEKAEYFHYTFYEKIFTEPDVLRHKLAYALSQIFVISSQSGAVLPRGIAMASYYDLLYQNCFGNFHDLLTDVSLHPAMGLYLSHWQNKKANPALGTFPDENYAREIMQLFTIGLYELNNDGSLKTDFVGDPIPTYTNTDVEELAKVFTGLSGGAYDFEKYPNLIGLDLVFWRGIGQFDQTVPMGMYEEEHEQGSKTLVDGSVIPGGLSGMTDIEIALDVLFNHDNVGPFLTLRLIQQLVKSNPSPAYINRVASVFNDNGNGVRGDLEAVVRAIYLDPEARDCIWLDDPAAGKMIQPLERLTQLCKAFDVETPSGKFYYWDRVYAYDATGQSILYSPSVFNFYTPFFAESNYIAPEGLVSPEFQILNSTSGISTMNLLENAVKVRPFVNRTIVNPLAPSLRWNADDYPTLDFSTEISIYENQGLTALIDHLDILICRGQLSNEVRSIIIDTINQYISNDSAFTSKDVVEDVLYFILASPSYSIMK